MEDIAVHCSWAETQLSIDSDFGKELPSNIRDIILRTDIDGSEYLQRLASASLQPAYTNTILALYQPLIPELTARWIAPEFSISLLDDVEILAAFARIFPVARYLRSRITTFISTSSLCNLLSGSALKGSKLDDTRCTTLLLAVFRLLSADANHFTKTVKPTFFSSLLSHDCHSVRYLAIQCMCILMRFADALSEKLVCLHIGDGAILGQWEDKTVDFRILKLFEEQRWQRIGKNFHFARRAANEASCNGSKNASVPPTSYDLSPLTANLGGVLIPRDAPLQNVQTSLVPTSTATRNLQHLANAILEPKPILITGVAGSGKTSLIREAAMSLNKHETMITLHLNEQTDAKSLLGLYTSSTTGDGFTWEPGVLTKAVQQGRWVVIEDINRAPSEVLGVLRPILETGQLFLPSRKEYLQPAEGFKIFATIRSSGTAGRSVATKHVWLTNERLWSVVDCRDYSNEEFMEILEQRHPRIKSLLREVWEAHVQIRTAYQEEALYKTALARLPSLRDLLKWCRRIDRRLANHNEFRNRGHIDESGKSDIFKDALDCYAAHHSNEQIYQDVADRMARVFNISPHQAGHLIRSGDSEVVEAHDFAKFGRSVLRFVQTRQKSGRSPSKFAQTDLARRTMDSIAAAASSAEPVLLVGETGVGKTTIVQHIAHVIHQKLTVVNLSQQSEATDLVGGLKPVTTRSLVIPVADQFDSLFDDTFSNKRNENFRTAISKALSKQNWPRLILLWTEAIELAEKSLQRSSTAVQNGDDTRTMKKRKLSTKYTALRERWNDFSSKVDSIRAQITRGDKNHTFAFVEGRLLQAVRGGEWLLLDEINLASADTLDHISSLLRSEDEGQPSILLTEAGKIDQIRAHPNFRLFAAMNPATDTGKKDLAPGLRSRFTEVYVQPGDTEVSDLVKIVECHLGSILSSDRKAALDLANAYLDLKKLSEQHKLVDGAGDIPHFSIRSLVRCLSYVAQHHAVHGLRRAMYEGFSMSFFTVLSRVSEDAASPIVNHHLLSHVKNHRAFLNQQPRYKPDDDNFIAFKHHLIRRGPEHPDLQPHYIRTPSVERNLMNLARAASMRRIPILLQGPTSAGKTSMIEYLAKISGNVFVRINNHEHTDLQEYVGNYATNDDGKLEFREGVLVDALRRGHWIVLDELNLAPTDVLEALNRLLDDNRELLIPESQEIVRPHANFMLFATQNPAGLYGGRKRLSRAFRNRFLELHFDDIPENELEVILRERAQVAPSFCTQIVQVYKKLSLQRQSTRLFEQRNSFATLRDLFRWAARPIADREQLAKHGFMLLAERVRDVGERQLVKRTIEETLKVSIDEDHLYSIANMPASARDNSMIVWTPAMRRLFFLLKEALQNNEPVLLVGETGCGKTQICQTMAESFGKNISIYNAHSNTETGDLIGSQRPVRQRSELIGTLLNSLRALALPELSSSVLENVEIDLLIKRFSQADTSQLDPGSVAQARKSIGAYQSLFGWVDGSLVRSMKAGEHFLLDEISLADDSVLERLNSVLESSRTLLLAEKGSVDVLVTAAPGFQFVGTMNPGGDYGKRELSAALRNRLTEIWVPPLSQSKDILPIVERKLAASNQGYAPIMLEFANWFKNEMQSSATSAIPLRSLLAWAEFINVNSNIEASSALVHGAAMVYVDSLGANPAGLTTAASDLAQSRRLCLDTLQSLCASVDVTSIYGSLLPLTLTRTEIKVGPFSLQRYSEAGTPKLVFDAPTTLKNTLRLVRALQMKRPILLEGSPGVGKTAIVTALATLVGKPLTRINLSDQTDLMDLFGADAPLAEEKLGRFAWKDGPLLHAMQTGSWVLLDEMNLASQSVLEGLNSCLDHRQEAYIAELDKSFKCHPEFTLFAAQNPHQQGNGRKGLPASFVNRFTIVYADSFELEDLSRICKATRPSISEGVLNYVLDTVTKGQADINKNSRFNAGGPWELNLRDVNRWLDLCAGTETLPPSHHLATVISHRFRTLEARKSFADRCAKSDDFAIASSLYTNLSVGSLQLGTTFLSRDVEMQNVLAQHELQPGRLPHAKSIITAINHKWPVLLVGESGSGKTSLIRTLAAFSGARLVEFPMNADVDTMDLIGSFEQSDNRRESLNIQRSVCETILTQLCHTLLDCERHDHIALLTTAFEECYKDDTDPANLLQQINRLSGQFAVFNALEEDIRFRLKKMHDTSSRFVWNDGVLIDAVRDGSWLILDHANLCNPSVLDRLNSLLEPNGHIVLDEQHNSEQEDKVLVPHENFRIFLTMDPRYGELSRAMRNRSLEIYLDDIASVSNQHLLSMPKYPTSATISRLRHLHSTSSDVDSLDVSFYQIEAAIEALSSKDKSIILPQLHHLLESNILGQAQSHLNSWKSLPSNVQQVVESNLQSIIESSGIAGGCISIEDQPELLLVNDALLSISLVDRAAPVNVSRRVLQEIAFGMLRARLSQKLSGTAKCEVSNASMLERAIASSTRRKKRDKLASLPAHDILDLFLNDIAGLTDFNTSADLIYRQDMVSLASDLYVFFDDKESDPILVQTFWQLLQDQKSSATPFQAAVSHVLSTASTLFGPQRSLKYGQGLQRMWPIYKPPTPHTWEQLETEGRMQALMKQFDHVTAKLLCPRSDLTLTRMRLTDAYHDIRASVLPPEAIVALENAIRELSRPELEEPRSSHFASNFGWLYQLLSLQRSFRNDQEAHMLGLLSFSPTSDLCEQADSVLVAGLRTISNVCAKVADDQEPSALFDQSTAVQSLVYDISNMQEQTLGSLNYVEEGVGILARTLCEHVTDIAAGPQSPVARTACEIIKSFLSSHQDHMAENFRHCSPFDILAILDEKSHDEVFKKNISGSDYFSTVFETHIRPSLSDLSTVGDYSLHRTGLALARSAVAALILIVPDNAYDPAQYSVLAAQRHQKRQLELQMKIDAHVRFQKLVTSQESSTLVEMYKNDLFILGEAPAVPKILRPASSQLLSIQHEFSNIIRGVLQSHHVAEVLFKNTDNAAYSHRIICETISRLTGRLSTFDRAYDDIVQPVVWLLNSLLLGLIMAQSAVPASTYDLSNTCTFGLMFDDIKTQGLLRWSLDINTSSVVDQEIFAHMTALVINYKTLHHEENIQTSILSEYLRITDNLYREWKAQLSKGQAEAEAQSRYYTYRGANENDPEVDVAELENLFPRYDDDEDSDDDRDMSGKKNGRTLSRDVRAQAIELGRLHGMLFDASEVSTLLSPYVLSRLKSCGHSSADIPQHSNVADALPAVFLQLENAIDNFTCKDRLSGINIYNDHDIVESRTLIKLVNDIKARFNQIQLQWPEHAAPVDVLTFCAEVLAFKINEPIAKLLSKTEKLLELVARWQSVASREWSVTNLVDALTSLIVHWRRLELSSWSRLLDQEKNKISEDAQGWYFIAYEAIIYNSRMVAESRESVEEYCTSLTRTLEEFVRSTTLGQFGHRLRLIDTFLQTLNGIYGTDSRMTKITSCVSNVLYHYRRCAEHVQTTLSNGRSELEKQITEQIKLASWKDTNIQSLRDSARRSHYKLFKIVKKFRSLLSQPLTSLKTSYDLSVEPSKAINGEPTYDQTRLHAASVQCATMLSDWPTRPSRLTDSLGAAMSIRKLYSSQESALNIAMEVANFGDNIVVTASELRKETPQTLDEDNKSLVKHLRERKRKFFADTMKSLTTFGIRRNLGTADLEKQASVSMILGGSPGSNLGLFPEEARSAADAFHEVLDEMSSVRLALREHSDDLTDGEVIRGAGLLEGFLSLMISQRASIMHLASEIEGITVKSKLLRNLHNIDATETVHATFDNKSLQQLLQRRLKWIPQVVKLVDQALRFQSRNTDMDFQHELDLLQRYAARCEEISANLLAQRQLPAELVTRSELIALQEHMLFIDEMSARLQDIQHKKPHVSHTIKQILCLLKPLQSSEATRSNGIVHTHLHGLDEQCQKVMNLSFVSMQRLSTIRSGLPEDTESSGWLLKCLSVHSDASKALHLRDFGTSVDVLFQQLEHLDEKDLTTGISLLIHATPVLDNVIYVAKNIYLEQLKTHNAICKLGVILSRHFIKLVKDGYCGPSDPSDGQDERSGKLESGTGLGEGEGAEDISKDIGADEDLSELAQATAEEQSDGKEMDKSKDAVDMGNDELEGEMGSGDEKEDDDEGGSMTEEQEEDGMDEETGSVDELDPSAVDEKMWDNMMNDEKKDEKAMQGDKQKGEKSDDQTAKADGEQGEDNEHGSEEPEQSTDEVSDDEAANEGQARLQEENIDPHLQEEEALDLPDDMQIGGDEDKGDQISDDGMDELSVMDVPENEIAPEEADNLSQPDQQENQTSIDVDAAGDASDDENSIEGQAQDDEIMEDQDVDNLEDEKAARDTEMQYDQDNNAGGESGQADQRQEMADPEMAPDTQGQNEAEKIVNEEQTQAGKGSEHEQSGNATSGAAEHGVGREEEQAKPQDQALKRLADLLDEFHKRREILTASEDRRQDDLNEDINMDEADFEHVGEDDDKADAQALGAAAQEQAQNLDQSRAIEHSDPTDPDQDLPMPGPDEDLENPEDPESLTERFNRLHAQAATQQESKSAIGETEKNRDPYQSDSKSEDQLMEEPSDEEDMESQSYLVRDKASPLTSTSDATALWSLCSIRTHSLSLLLTEQLRLILAPTTATKLRGDFRTGKRLNIKRIIPYIASGYKRDKIWMRRSIPSKRNYQIMVAVDDSKSMSEFGADLLAFETVAMLSKSLSMLEAGELCVVGFGEEDHIRIAHPFDKPFTSTESGPEVFRNFTFKQKGTDVRKLIRESTSIFQEARLRTSSSSSSDDLWQLQLIVSDGHCSDHDSIRRLVLAAHQQRIMIVFVIVDAGKDSIVDLKEAVFERIDPLDEKSEMKVKTKRYLEGFPFQYYVVVRDVADLPGVLARVLKGWFESVVDV